MKRVLLIHGDPGNGKSTLAKILKDQYFFNTVPVDDVYVDFILNKFHSLHFEALNRYIAPHYFWIREYHEYIRKDLGRDPIDDWHEHLLTTIKELSNLYDDLVVEGFLLYDCKDQIENALPKGVKTFQVYVKDREYTVQDKIVVPEQIAALGKASG